MASVAKRNWTHNGVKGSGWVVRWKEGGKHRSKGFDLKRDADAYQRKMEREIEDGVHIPPSEVLTLRMVCDMYLKNCEDRARDGKIGRSRLISVQTCLRKDIVPNLGHLKMTALTSAIVEEWYWSIRRVDKLEQSTCRAKLYILKHVEKFALRRKLVKLQPVSEATEELKGFRSPKIRTFSTDEIGRLLDAAKRPGANCKPHMTNLLEIYVNLGAFCGLRYGEISALSLDDLNFKDRIIHVRHNLTRWSDLKGTKTKAGVRDFPMPEHVANMLTMWIRHFYVENERRLVFRNSSGGDCNGGNFHNQSWGPLLSRAGLADGERFHFHALRHFAASYMIHIGFSIIEVAALLGHSKFDMTLQVYAHPVVGGMRRHDLIGRMSEDILSRPVTIDCATVTQAALSP